MIFHCLCPWHICYFLQIFFITFVIKMVEFFSLATQNYDNDKLFINKLSWLIYAQALIKPA